LTWIFGATISRGVTDAIYSTFLVMHYYVNLKNKKTIKDMIYYDEIIKIKD